MGRFAKEVEDFVSAFKAGSEIGYKMRYLRYLEQQQRLQQQRFDYNQRFRRRPDGMPGDTDSLIEQGRDRFRPGSENQTPAPASTPPTKTAAQETVQPKPAAIPDATPHTKAPAEKPESSTPRSEGGGSTGSGSSAPHSEKHASILDRYPGSYQTAALETGTMNDASPMRSAVSPRIAESPLPSGGKGSVSPSALYTYLIDKGATKNQATMLTAAAGAESGWRPALSHDKGTGYGLWGHRNERWDAMARMAGDRHPGWQQQADYALWELNNSKDGGIRRANAQLANATTPEQIAVAQMHFERPVGYTPNNPTAGHNFDGRLKLVRQVSSGSFGGRATTPGNAPATATPGSHNQDAGNAHQRTAALETNTRTDASPAPAPATQGATPHSASVKTPSSTASAVPPGTQAVPMQDTGTHAAPQKPSAETPLPPKRPDDLGAAPLPPKRPEDLNPEFPANKTDQTPMPPKRSDEMVGPPMPEQVKPAVDPTQPQPTLQPAQQQDGWSFLDDIGQGFEQLGADVESFFSNLDVPADWDVGSGGDWGTAGGGDAFGGIGDAIGGIGDAIGGALGGMFNRGGMVR